MVRARLHAQRAVHLGLHAARDGLQLLAELLGLAVVLIDFGDDGEQFFGALGKDFVGDHQIRHDQHVADHGGIFAQHLRHGQNFANHQSRAGDGFAYGGLTALDALGEFDFAFAREQRHRSHFAQVHAHRIVGLVVEFLNEIEFAGFFGFLNFFVELGFGFFEDLDAGGVELGEQVVEFAAAGIVFGEQIVDFVIQHVALLLARAHELLHPSEFFAACHAYSTPSTRESDCMNSRHAVATSVQHQPTASFALFSYPSRLTSSSRRCNSAVQ